jgi:hypothetical protein
MLTLEQLIFCPYGVPYPTHYKDLLLELKFLFYLKIEKQAYQLAAKG